jgi:putative membrane protein
MHITRWWSHRRGMPGLLLGPWGCLVAADALAADMWDMPMMRGGWGILMMLMMLLFWVAVLVVIIVGIRWLVTSGRRQAPVERSPESALDILKKRYARGEISKQEFDDMRQHLQ